MFGGPPGRGWKIHECSAVALGVFHVLKRRLLRVSLLSAGAYIRARVEVAYALLTGSISSGEQSEDTLRPFLIPSVHQGDWTDRVIAEIDQDGRTFAADECDTPFFGGNQPMRSRRYNRVQIVLRGRRIYLRKSLISNRRSTLKAAILDSLRWGFYIEAAALLRLRGLSGVPRIRRVEPLSGAIEMDYILGRDLRQILSAGRGIIYAEIERSFKALLASDNEIASQIRTLLNGLVERGVIHRDVHAANFIVAERSNRLYIVDFQVSHLR
jgi:predicted Ser/Thr protein kinase